MGVHSVKKTPSDLLVGYFDFRIIPSAYHPVVVQDLTFFLSTYACRFAFGKYKRVFRCALLFGRMVIKAYKTVPPT